MSKAGEVAAAVGVTVGTALAVAGLVTVAILCPEAIPKTPPKRVVVVKPGAPTPGVPAYRIPCGPPRAVKLPRGYTHQYVVYNGQNCNIVRQPNGQCYYIWGGRHYPVVYY